MKVLKNYTYFSLLLLLTILSSCGPSNKNPIIGEWVQVREENRLGYIYDDLGRELNDPSIILTFNEMGIATYYDPEIPEPKFTHPYRIANDTSLYFYKVYQIIKLTKDTLILIVDPTFIQSPREDDDPKWYFVKRRIYKNLSEQEKNAWKAPTQKDLQYRDSILAEQKRRDEMPRDKVARFPGGESALNKYFREELKKENETTKCKGMIFVKAYVEPTGELTEIKIKESECPNLNTTVLKAVKNMPTWEPAMINGEIKRMDIVIPVYIGKN